MKISNEGQKKNDLRWLLLSFVAIFILGLVIFKPVDYLLKTRFEIFLNRNIDNSKVTVGGLSVRLLSSLHFRDIRIVPSVDQNNPFLNIESAKIDFSFSDLFRGRIVVQSIDIQGMHVDLLHDSSGTLFLPHVGIFKKRSHFQKGNRLKLNCIDVANSSIRYLDKLIPLDGSLKNLIIAVQNEGENAYGFLLSSDAIAVNWKGVCLTGNRIALSGSLNSKQIRFNSIQTTLSGQTVTGSVELTRTDSSDSLRGQFQIRGDPGFLPDSLFLHFPKQLLPMDGVVEVAVDLGGSLDDPIIQTGIDVPLLKAGDNEICDCSIQIGWQDGILTLNNFQSRLLGGRISGEGEFISGTNRINKLRFKAAEIDLNQFMKIAGQPDSLYEGKVDASVLASATALTPMKWNVGADLEIRQIKCRTRSIPDMKTRFQLQNGSAVLSLDHPDAVVFAETKFINEKMDGRFQIRLPRLQIFSEAFNLPELQGEISVRGILGGTLKSPMISADFHAGKILFHNFPLDTCAGQIQLRDNEMIVKTCQFAGELESLDSLQFFPLLKSMKGGLSYRGQAKGSLSNPEIDLFIMLAEPSYQAVRFDTGNVVLRLSDHRAELTRFELVRDSLLLDISGGYSLHTSKGQLLVHLLKKSFYTDRSVPSEQVREDHSNILRIRFNIADESNMGIETTGERIDLKSAAMLLSSPKEIAGQLQFHSEMSGSLDRPSVRLKLSIRDMNYRESKIDSVFCLAGMDNACFSIKYLTLFKDRESTRLNGTLCLTKTGEGKWTIDGESATWGSTKGSNTDLSIFNPLLPHGMRVSGLMHHNLRWKGSVRNPLLRGSIHITGGELRLSSDAPSIQSISADIVLKDSLLEMVPVSGIIQQIPFRFEGNIQTRELKTSDIRMRLFVSNQEALAIQGTLTSDSVHIRSRMDNLNLALFQPMLPDLENLQGSIQAQVDLQGLQADPQLNGFVCIESCAFKIPDSDLSFNRGQARLTLHDKQITLDTLSLSAGQGFISSRGAAVYSKKDIENIHISTSVKAVKMKRAGEFIATVDSAMIQTEKKNNEYYLSGDIVLGETRLIKSIQPKALLAAIEKKSKPIRDIPAFSSRVHFNVRLLESDKIWIDNNLARLRLHSELVLTGSMAQPILSGRLSAKEGYILYLDRKFKIENGTLDFVDPNRINPVVELSASSNIKSYQTRSHIPYTVWLKIKGPLDEAIVELTSDPPLERSDIIALLTVGATQDQIMGRYENGKAMTLSSILRERASELSGQQISGYVTKKMGGLLGLDEMTIEGNLFRFGKTWGPQLLASKKLNNRMEISYTATAGDANEQNIRLDYKLSDHLSLEGETDQKGQSGLDLKYQLKFK